MKEEHVSSRTDQEFSTFVDLCGEAVAEQVAGRTDAFHALWSREEDVVLIGAAGSHQQGWHDVSARLPWTSSHLNFGGFHVENLLTSVSGALAFTVDLEHMDREVDGTVEERTLRVSQGYRLENARWRIVFRHGDPLAADSLPLPSD
jgi:hypothetical protein